MLFTRLYRLFWLLLHFVACAYETLCWLCLRLQAATLWSYDHLSQGSTAVARSDRTFLESCKVQLSKIPRHLCIIVGPDEDDGARSWGVNEAMLTRIFTYALIMGIDCISLYDTRQDAVKRSSRGRKSIVLENLKSGSGWCRQLDEHHFEWVVQMQGVANGTKFVGSKNGCANGSSNGHLSRENSEKSIEIFEITPHDGRPLIAEVCRDLFEKRESAEVQHLLKDRMRLTQRIDEELSKRLYKDFPDPELGIIFNRHTCTFGTLPWQTRFTEFHTLESGHYFDSESFAKVLFRYSRCEQRWGK